MNMSCWPSPETKEAGCGQWQHFQLVIALQSSGIHLTLHTEESERHSLSLSLSPLPHIRHTNEGAHLLGSFRLLVTSSVNLLQKYYRNDNEWRTSFHTRFKQIAKGTTVLLYSFTMNNNGKMCADYKISTYAQSDYTTLNINVWQL